jgi:cytochrome c556
MRCVALVALLTIFQGGSDGTKEKTPSVKEIMQKLHGGRDGLRTKLNKEMRASKPDWEQIERETKEFVKFAEALGKNNPPRGDRQSWDRLTGLYVASAKDMDTAAEKHDVAGFKAAFNKMGGSCLNCHNAHRPRQ